MKLRLSSRSRSAACAAMVMIALLLSGASAAQTDTIAYWAQNDNTLPGGGFGFAPGSFPQAADDGVLAAQASLSLANFDDSVDGDDVYNCIASFGGTTDNALAGYASGGSLSPQGCASNSNNGMHVDLAISTVGFENIVLSWAQRGTGTGFNSRQVSYSTDGGVSFTPFATDSGALSATWTVPNFDLSAIPALNDNADVVLRITLDGATSASGNNRFDNIRIDGDSIPELLAKSGPDFALAGEELTFQIALSNLSQSENLEAIEVTDSLPAGLNYVSDTSGVTPSNPVAGTYIWSLPDDLAPGATLVFDLTVMSDASISAGSVLVNQAELSAEQAGQPVNAQAEWAVSFPALLTIYDVQAVADPVSDDSSPLLGQTVVVEGVITAAPGEISGNGTLVMQDPAGGAYSGVVVDGDFSNLTLARGDLLRVRGLVVENNGLTRITATDLTLLASPGALSPEVLATADFPEQDPAASEPWESVLIEFQSVDVTAELTFGEWQFSDGTGIARGDDEGSITLAPAVGDSYSFLRGIGWFSFANYKVEPRDNLDIDVAIPVYEISEIQGEGLRSPFAPVSGNDPGDLVRTENNIVTAVGLDSFTIQMPDDRDSSDLPLASRGLYVFTGSLPTVSVGDRVDVQGSVVEFFDLTQIGFPDLVEVVDSGNSLPQTVIFDDQTPSADPENPSCGINNFECFESMRVTLANGFVTAPSQRFGSDPIAEAVVSATGERVLRGAGVEFPGLGAACPDCPVWSGAPERFELDPDKLGLANQTLAGGTRFSATGVIGFEFGDYELWPTELAINEVPELPIAVPASAPDQLTIGSLNGLDLFDTVQNGPRPIPACDAGYIADDRLVTTAAEYDLKLDKLAATVIDALALPDVLAMQEVESVATLNDLADRIASLTGNAVAYTPFLEFGNDRGNINNGYLVNQARVAVDAVILEGGDECLSSDDTPLHDRPTLTLEARFIADGADWPFVVMNNHFRSLSNVESSARTRLKRHEQAQSVASKLQARQSADPLLPIILVGDKNAFQFTDGFVDLIGLLSGTSVESENLVNIENAAVPGFDPSNQVAPPLISPLDLLPEDQRYSFIFQGVAQVLDHALLGNAASRYLADFGYMRGNADYWRGFEDDAGSIARSSDHDGLVLILEPNRDIDTIFADRFESP